MLLANNTANSTEIQDITRKLSSSDVQYELELLGLTHFDNKASNAFLIEQQRKFQKINKNVKFK